MEEKPNRRIYRAPQPVSDRDAMDIIARDDIGPLQTLPIGRFIQDVCVRLSTHRDSWVRSNALLGLIYSARFRGKVEKNIVKPVLLRSLKDSDPPVAQVAQGAIDDINHLMKWKIGGAKKQKQLERRFWKKDTPPTNS